MKYQPGRPTHVHTRCGRMCALSYGIIDAYATTIYLHASAGIFGDTCIADILEVNKTKTTRATSLQLELGTLIYGCIRLFFVMLQQAFSALLVALLANTQYCCISICYSQTTVRQLD